MKNAGQAHNLIPRKEKTCKNLVYGIHWISLPVRIVVLLKSKISKLNVICQLPCYDNHGMIGDEAARDIVIDTEKKRKYMYGKHWIARQAR